MREHQKFIFPNGKSVRTMHQLIDQFAKVKILVIGDWILDEFVWGTVERDVHNEEYD